MRTWGTVARRLRGDLRGLRSVLKPQDFAKYLLYCARLSPWIIESRQLASVDTRMKGRLRISFRNTEIRVDLKSVDELLEGDAPTFSGIREMFCRDVYLRFFDLSRMNLVNVIDAGGNRGLFSVYAALHAKKVVWVEPQPKYLRTLHLLLSANAPRGEVIPLLGFLHGSKAAAVPAFWQEKRANVSEVVDRSYTVRGIMLRHNMDPVSLLKMDVEGAEFPILLTSTDWIQSLENLAIEVHRGAGNPAEIVQYLSASKFEVLTKNADLDPCSPSSADYIYASRTGALCVGGGSTHSPEEPAPPHRFRA